MSAFASSEVGPIKECYIKVHNQPNCPIDVFAQSVDEAPWQFGICGIEMNKVGSTTSPIFILFTVDCSGSMDDLDSHNVSRSKIYYVKNTLENIFRYIAKFPETCVHIRVELFNTVIKNVIEKVQVTNENLEELILKINEIEPNDQTNIELAMKNAEQIMAQTEKDHPDHIVHHLFLTDGDANEGEANAKQLSKLLSCHNRTIFIGIGKGHNANMLQTFSQRHLTEYRFIDNSENAGMVYGEILAQIMHPALMNVNITVGDGEIYNWQTNIWTNKLFEFVFESEAKKIYHMRTRNPAKMFIALDSEAIQLHHVCKHSEKQVDNAAEPENIDLTNYMFRQCVLELLYKCRNASCETKHNRSEMRELKETINKLFRRQRAYMRTNNLLLDPFMRRLCDDLAVAYRTMGTEYASMYCGARQGSQGRQETYSAKYGDDEDNIAGYTSKVCSPPKLRRHRHHHHYADTFDLIQPKLTRHDASVTFPDLSNVSASAIEPITTFYGEDVKDMEDEEDAHLEGGSSSDLLQFILRGEYAEPPQKDAMSISLPMEEEDDIENYTMDTSEDMDETMCAYTTPSRMTVMRSLSAPRKI